jgi:hypothetical protein
MPKDYNLPSLCVSGTTPLLLLPNTSRNHTCRDMDRCTLSSPSFSVGVPPLTHTPSPSGIWRTRLLRLSVPSRTRRLELYVFTLAGADLRPTLVDPHSERSPSLSCPRELLRSTLILPTNRVGWVDSSRRLKTRICRVSSTSSSRLEGTTSSGWWRRLRQRSRKPEARLPMSTGTHLPRTLRGSLASRDKRLLT